MTKSSMAHIIRTATMLEMLNERTNFVRRLSHSSVNTYILQPLFRSTLETDGNVDSSESTRLCVSEIAAIVLACVVVVGAAALHLVHKKAKTSVLHEHLKLASVKLRVFVVLNHPSYRLIESRYFLLLRY